MDQETAIGGSNAVFQPTLWTIVLRARDLASPERQQALNQLIQAYWKPAYFFIRRRGVDVETAKDLTQSFFLAFVEKDFLKNVSPDKGRFRSFVLAALSYYLSDQHDRSRAKKRGGDFNFVAAEQELPAAGATPEEAFFRQWAVDVLSRTISSMRSQCTPEEFALLTGEPPQEMESEERKSKLHRLRVRLREHLRDIIRPSVGSESEVDEEIRDLFSNAL
jgi:RNA polymerase sigma-70 factor (ECF subfamily)